jgi:hypothetical protein
VPPGSRIGKEDRLDELVGFNAGGDKDSTTTAFKDNKTVA